MMGKYTSFTYNSSRRAAFAKECVEAEFRPGAVRLAAGAGFADRPPHQPPFRLDQITTAVIGQMAEHAVAYWLEQAVIAETPGDRDEAFRVARRIAEQAGLILPADLEAAA